MPQLDPSLGNRLLRPLVAALLLVGAAGCVTVAPYERERLAKQDMQMGSHPDSRAGEDHARAYREGSTGAEGTSGGGCGCN